MKLLAPKNTLEYQLQGRPLSCAIDFQKGSMQALGKQMAEMNAKGKWSVPNAAGQFYLYNHAVAEIRKRFSMFEPLPQEHLNWLEKYNAFGAQLVSRMIGYVAIICLRESRHCHDQKPIAEAVEKIYGKAARSFIFATPDDAASSMQYAMNSVPADLEIGPAMGALSYCFRKGKWSSSFGGPKWAVIAETLWKAAKAEITPEVFLDIAFTLAHNGGPIFNKGVIFDYPNQKHLLTVLDCQRAGVIPALYIDGGWGVLNTPLQLVKEAKLIQQQYETDSTVDWNKVEKLGAVQSYSQFKKTKPQPSDPNAPTGTPGIEPVKPAAPVIPVLSVVDFWPTKKIKVYSRENIKKVMAADTVLAAEEV